MEQEEVIEACQGKTGGDWETLDEASEVTWDLGVMWTSGLSSWVTVLLAWT